MNLTILKIVPALLILTSPLLLLAVEGESTIDDLAKTMDTQEVFENLEPRELAASMLRIAKSKIEAGQQADAKDALYLILDSRPGEELEATALSLLAQSYRKSGNPTRAAAIHEKLMETYPGSTEIPWTLLELGRIYRELGADRLAMARFYSVLNATLKIPANRLSEYQLIARTAQYEIAETHLNSGRYKDAGRYFKRLSLLDLAPEDRQRAQFKHAYAMVLSGQFAGAAELLEPLLMDAKVFPEEAEARHLLAISLEKIGDYENALSVALTLFDPERINANPESSWRYWQRRTGNQLANAFFQHNRMRHALALYEQLASLSEDARWRAPALYQVALSAEHLGNIPKARDAYNLVIELGQENEALNDISRMAEWRNNHLEWNERFEAQHRRMMGSPATSGNFSQYGDDRSPDATKGS